MEPWVGGLDFGGAPGSVVDSGSLSIGIFTISRCITSRAFVRWLHYSQRRFEIADNFKTVGVNVTVYIDCVDIDDVWSVTPASIFNPWRTTDFALISKVQMISELLFARDGYFTFNDFPSLTVSDAISLIDSIRTG